MQDKKSVFNGTGGERGGDDSSGGGCCPKMVALMMLTVAAAAATGAVLMSANASWKLAEVEMEVSVLRRNYQDMALALRNVIVSKLISFEKRNLNK